jgi:hypothetical protein
MYVSRAAKRALWNSSCRSELLGPSDVCYRVYFFKCPPLLPQEGVTWILPGKKNEARFVVTAMMPCTVFKLEEIGHVYMAGILLWEWLHHRTEHGFYAIGLR